MTEKPAITPDGYGTNTEPVPGTRRTRNASATGPAFSHPHGRRLAQCPCGKQTTLTHRGNLRRHKQPKEQPPPTPSPPLTAPGVDGPPRPARHWPTAAPHPHPPLRRAQRRHTPLSPPGPAPRSRSPRPARP